MAQWKKIITSGSNAALNNITASNNISASGNLFISSSENSTTSFNTLVIDTNTGQVFHTGSYAGGGGGGGNGTQITLGADTTGNLLLNAGTTVQSSIDQINSVLDLLAPTVPPNLSAISLNFFGTNNYSAIDKDGNTISSITNDTSPSFLTSESFFDGDSGVLRAQHFPSSSGAVGTGYNSGFSVFDINLDTDDNTGINNILQIVSDTDPYAGQAGSSGFYKVLSAKINLTGLTPNNVGDYQRNTVRLIHTQTGVNGIDKEFTLDSDPVSSVTNLEFSYDESINEFHYQSGIKYLGNTNDITASYKVTIDSNANFINTSGRIAQISNSPDVFSSPYKTVSSFTPGQLYNVTHSLDVNDNEFNTSNITLFGRNFKASSTSFATNQTNTIISNLLIDSKQEDETKPNNGASLPLRVKSGEDQYPSFGTSTGNFGGTFDSTANISSSGYELQFANEYFHWPASTNYTSYTPSGPNYTGIDGDNSNSSLRYITFKLGDILNKTSLTLSIKNAYGFDNALVQTSDNFQFHLMIVNVNTPITNWMDVNKVYDTSDGDPTDTNGKACLTGGTVASSGDLNRNITFAAGGVQTGTVYVRVGWDVNGGTSATSTSTRKFKYITKS